jgi:hypothetical protein
VVAFRHFLQVSGRQRNCLPLEKGGGGDLSAVISMNISRRHLVAGARDSPVGIATRYGLDGQGFESRWRRDFPQPSRLVLWPTQPSIQWVPGLYRG